MAREAERLGLRELWPAMCVHARVRCEYCTQEFRAHSALARLDHIHAKAVLHVRVPSPS